MAPAYTNNYSTLFCNSKSISATQAELEWIQDLKANAKKIKQKIERDGDLSQEHIIPQLAAFLKKYPYTALDNETAIKLLTSQGYCDGFAFFMTTTLYQHQRPWAMKILKLLAKWKENTVITKEDIEDVHDFFELIFKPQLSKKILAEATGDWHKIAKKVCLGDAPEIKRKRNSCDNKREQRRSRAIN